jgi:hypothetical protein
MKATMRATKPTTKSKPATNWKLTEHKPFAVGREPKPKQWASHQVERALLRVLEPAVQARGGQVYTLSGWTLAGHGIVLVPESGQEFWLTVCEAGC